MFSRIEEERVRLEADNLYPVDSRSIYCFLYFSGCFGLPFFYIGDKNSGYTCIMSSLLISIYPYTIGDIDKFWFLLILLSWAVYTIVFFDRFNMITNLNKEQKEKKYKYLSNRLNAEHLDKRYDNEIEAEIYINSKENPELNKRSAGIFWFFGFFMGFYSLYVGSGRNAFLLLSCAIFYKFFLVVTDVGYVLHPIIGLILNIFSLLGITLFLAYYYINGFYVNRIVENNNYQTRMRKLSFLNELEKKYNEKSSKKEEVKDV